MNQQRSPSLARIFAKGLKLHVLRHCRTAAKSVRIAAVIYRTRLSPSPQPPIARKNRPATIVQ
ncbi:hypothetical protein QP175_15540 [Sphingomonas aerolata]|uniref:hypothetical protein n=1 Tax=Sphingomonas aerolata TaxID=185951 RepID=UPI002FE14F2F